MCTALGLGMRPFDIAWNLLKALPEQQVIEPVQSGSHRVKTLHPAIQGMMQRRGTLQPEGQRMHNESRAPIYPEQLRDGETLEEQIQRIIEERRVPEGYLQGGWRTSQRPQSDMSMGDVTYPHDLDYYDNEWYRSPDNATGVTRGYSH